MTQIEYKIPRYIISKNDNGETEKMASTGPINYGFCFVLFLTKESKLVKDRTRREQQTNENMELTSLSEKSINDEVRQDLASTLQGHLV